MNRKGFIFTLDATLSLIPIFLLLASASSLAPSTSFGTARHLRMSQFAQDSMMLLSDKIGNISSPLESYLDDSSTTSIENFLRNTSNQWNYMIQYNTSTEWDYVAGKSGSSLNPPISYDPTDVNASFGAATDIAVATKVVTNTTEGDSTLYLFRMYVWG